MEGLLNSKSLTEEELRSLFNAKNQGGFTPVDRILQDNAHEKIETVLKGLYNTQFLTIFLESKGEDGNTISEAVKQEFFKEEQEIFFKRMKDGILYLENWQDWISSFFGGGTLQEKEKLVNVHIDNVGGNLTYWKNFFEQLLNKHISLKIHKKEFSSLYYEASSFIKIKLAEEFVNELSNYMQYSDPSFVCKYVLKYLPKEFILQVLNNKNLFNSPITDVGSLFTEIEQMIEESNKLEKTSSDLEKPYAIEALRYWTLFFRGNPLTIENKEFEDLYYKVSSFAKIRLAEEFVKEFNVYYIQYENQPDRCKGILNSLKFLPKEFVLQVLNSEEIIKGASRYLFLEVFEESVKDSESLQVIKIFKLFEEFTTKHSEEKNLSKTITLDSLADGVKAINELLSFIEQNSNTISFLSFSNNKLILNEIVNNIAYILRLFSDQKEKKDFFDRLKKVIESLPEEIALAKDYDDYNIYTQLAYNTEDILPDNNSIALKMLSLIEQGIEKYRDKIEIDEDHPVVILARFFPTKGNAEVKEKTNDIILSLINSMDADTIGETGILHNLAEDDKAIKAFVPFIENNPKIVDRLGIPNDENELILNEIIGRIKDILELFDNQKEKEDFFDRLKRIIESLPEEVALAKDYEDYNIYTQLAYNIKDILPDNNSIALKMLSLIEQGIEKYGDKIKIDKNHPVVELAKYFPTEGDVEVRKAALQMIALQINSMDDKNLLAKIRIKKLIDIYSKEQLEQEIDSALINKSDEEKINFKQFIEKSFVKEEASRKVFNLFEEFYRLKNIERAEKINKINELLSFIEQNSNIISFPSFWDDELILNEIILCINDILKLFDNQKEKEDLFDRLKKIIESLPEEVALAKDGNDYNIYTQLAQHTDDCGPDNNSIALKMLSLIEDGIERYGDKIEIDKNHPVVKLAHYLPTEGDVEVQRMAMQIIALQINSMDNDALTKTDILHNLAEYYKLNVVAEYLSQKIKELPDSVLLDEDDVIICFYGNYNKTWFGKILLTKVLHNQEKGKLIFEEVICAHSATLKRDEVKNQLLKDIMDASKGEERADYEQFIEKVFSGECQAGTVPPVMQDFT